MSDDNLKSLIIGMIDGDGSIEKSGRISMCAHKSWGIFLSKGINKAFPWSNTNKTFVRNNVILRLNGGKNVWQKIKEEALRLELPFLERKWNRIT